MIMRRKICLHLLDCVLAYVVDFFVHYSPVKMYIRFVHKVTKWPNADSAVDCPLKPLN